MGVTGYYREPWHWRFVGPIRALYLRPVDPHTGICASGGQTIEEYLAQHPEEAESGDCGPCSEVSHPGSQQCLNLVSQLPLPPPSPAVTSCTACAFVPPGSRVVIETATCTGSEPTITLNRGATRVDLHGAAGNEPAIKVIIRSGDAVQIVNNTTREVKLTERGQPAITAGATECLSFHSPGNYGVYELEKGTSGVIVVQ